MNKVIVACAGSGKTTYIVNAAINIKGKVLITTFTDTNVAEISKKIMEKCGYFPPDILVMPWFTFQLDHLIRPYQPSFIDERITNVRMSSGKSTRFISKEKKEYYLSNGEIYSDKIATLAFQTLKMNQNTIKRLKRLFNCIFIDEFQDFAGYDLDIVKYLAEEGMSIQIVGDPRQHTYSTHYSQKNLKFSCEPIDYIKSKCKHLFEIDEVSLNGSYRCPQNAIRYASTIFPDLPQSDSKKSYEMGDGILFIKKNEVESFLFENRNVLQLRHSKRTIVNKNYTVTTFGKSKGVTVDNVVIYPTNPMLDAIKKNNFSNYNSKSDLYVALTRAEHKTAIVVSDDDFEEYESIRKKYIDILS